MKKILFLLVLLLLCSCAPVPVTMPPTPDWTKSHSAPTADWSGYQPSIEAFQLSEQCPHLCWLGINPGVTTAEEAHKLVTTSDQIDQASLEATETGIVVKWFTEKTHKLDSSVYMRLNNGLVTSIAFDRLAPFTLKDFIALIGDPYGINIDMNIHGDIMEMPYGAYYDSRDILLAGEAAETGLHPNDPLNSLMLNIPYNKEIFRPWVGYGHLAEYFTGKEVHEH